MSCWNPSCTSRNRGMSRSLQRCTRCHCARYCSRTCQAQDWKTHHKAICQPNIQPKKQWSFDDAPDPPNHVSNYTCMKWDHPTWKTKVCKGEYVLTREVREEMLECRGYWPTFDAPDFLNHTLFKKFCYYAEDRQDIEALSDLPKGLVPIEYVDKPQAWYERQRIQEENERQFYERIGNMRDLNPEELKRQRKSDESDSGTDDDDEESMQSSTIKATDSHVSLENIVRLKPLCPEGKDLSANLVGMNDNARLCISDFLPPNDVTKLRQLDSSCRNWPRSRPFYYNTIVFVVTNSFNDARVGVAKTFQDMINAVDAIKKKVDQGDDEVNVLCKFFDFDTNREGRSKGKKISIERALPIVSIAKREYYESYNTLLYSTCDENGTSDLPRKFLGVKCSFEDCATYSPYVNDRVRNYDKDKKWEIDDATILHTLSKCTDPDFKPRKEIDLTRYSLISADNTYELWYNFPGFATTSWDYTPKYSRASIQYATDKSWMIFPDSIELWDKY